MSDWDRDAVFTIAPAGSVSAVIARQSKSSTVVVNTMINEAMAARDLLRVDKAKQTIELTGHPEEFLRYVRCREHTEQAMRDCGWSIEQARWHRTWPAEGDTDA